MLKIQLTVSRDVQESGLHTDQFLRMVNVRQLVYAKEGATSPEYAQCGYCCGSDLGTGVPVSGTQNLRVQASVCPSAAHRQVLQSFL